MIACIRLPYFAASVERNLNPELVDVPLVIVQHDATRPLIYAPSAAAAQAGIKSGMTLRAAQAHCPELAVMPVVTSRYRRAADQVLELLAEYANHVELEQGFELRADARQRRRAEYIPTAQLDEQASAVFYLDLGKQDPGTSLDLAWRIYHAVLQQLGLVLAVAAASTKFTARGAAFSLQASAAFVVPPGDEAHFLSEFPVTLLPLDGETLRQLHLLGLNTLGQIARLPAGALLDRFGKAGGTMHRLANGRDSSRVLPYVPRYELSALHTFDTGVTDSTILEHSLHALGSSLVRRSLAEGYLVSEVALVLELEHGPSVEHAVALRQPLAAVGDSAGLLDELLASVHMHQGVVGVELILSGAAPLAGRQLSLFEREPVSQERLHAVLQRLIARYGDDCFYRVALVSTSARLPERRFRIEQVDSK